MPMTAEEWARLKKNTGLPREYWEKEFEYKDSAMAQRFWAIMEDIAGANASVFTDREVGETIDEPMGFSCLKARIIGKEETPEGRPAAMVELHWNGATRYGDDVRYEDGDHIAFAKVTKGLATIVPEEMDTRTFIRETNRGLLRYIESCRKEERIAMNGILSESDQMGMDLRKKAGKEIAEKIMDLVKNQPDRLLNAGPHDVLFKIETTPFRGDFRITDRPEEMKSARDRAGWTQDINRFPQEWNYTTGKDGPFEAPTPTDLICNDWHERFGNADLVRGALDEKDADKLRDLGFDWNDHPEAREKVCSAWDEILKEQDTAKPEMLGELDAKEILEERTDVKDQLVHEEMPKFIRSANVEKLADAWEKELDVLAKARNANIGNQYACGGGPGLDRQKINRNEYLRTASYADGGFRDGEYYKLCREAEQMAYKAAGKQGPEERAAALRQAEQELMHRLDLTNQLSLFARSEREQAVLIDCWQAGRWKGKEQEKYREIFGKCVKEREEICRTIGKGWSMTPGLDPVEIVSSLHELPERARLSMAGLENRMEHLDYAERCSAPLTVLRQFNIDIAGDALVKQEDRQPKNVHGRFAGDKFLWRVPRGGDPLEALGVNRAEWMQRETARLRGVVVDVMVNRVKAAKQLERDHGVNKEKSQNRGYER